MSAIQQPASQQPASQQAASQPPAAELLQHARARERAGAMSEAVQHYTAAIESAERQAEPGVLAEALRRLGVVYHHQNERDLAGQLCQRSYQTATAIGDPVLAAEALNAL